MDKIKFNSDLFSSLRLARLCTYNGILQYDYYQCEFGDGDGDGEGVNIEYDDFIVCVNEVLKNVFGNDGFVKGFFVDGLGLCGNIKVLNFEFVKSYQPRYYNFECDSVYFDVTFDRDPYIYLLSVVRKYILDNDKCVDLNEFLSMYKSRDGFISATPSNVNELLAGLKDMEVNALSVIIDYLICKVGDYDCLGDVVVELLAEEVANT